MTIWPIAKDRAPFLGLSTKGRAVTTGEHGVKVITFRISDKHSANFRFRKRRRDNRTRSTFPSHPIFLSRSRSRSVLFARRHCIYLGADNWRLDWSSRKKKKRNEPDFGIYTSVYIALFSFELSSNTAHVREMESTESRTWCYGGGGKDGFRISNFPSTRARSFLSVAQKHLFSFFFSFLSTYHHYHRSYHQQQQKECS